MSKLKEAAELVLEVSKGTDLTKLSAKDLTGALKANGYKGMSVSKAKFTKAVATSNGIQLAYMASVSEDGDEELDSPLYVSVVKGKVVADF